MICLPLEVTISHSKEKEQEKKRFTQFGFTKTNKEINKHAEENVKQNCFLFLICSHQLIPLMLEIRFPT